MSTLFLKMLCYLSTVMEFDPYSAKSNFRQNLKKFEKKANLTYDKNFLQYQDNVIKVYVG